MVNSATEQLRTFQVAGGDKSTCRIVDPNLTVGAVAASLAARKGLAGRYEVVNEKTGQTIDPQMRLVEIPAEDTLTLSPEMTPASVAG